MSSTPTAGLSPRTIMQLPVTRRAAELYVANRAEPGLSEPSRMWGLCSRGTDVADAASGAEARAVHGLDEDAAADFPKGDGLFVIRFQASWPGLFEASFGGQTTAGAARLNSTLVLPAPFLGTGYTKYAPRAVPEFWMRQAEIPIGAELWHLAEDGGDGAEQCLARYQGIHSGWHALPAAGERGLTPGPHTAHDGVPHGLTVTYQGGRYHADFGPEPGYVTAYRAAEDGTMMSLRLSDGQCENVVWQRLVCTWRGAEFEVLFADEESVVLADFSGNAEQAARLGLTPAGRHAWRAMAPRAELGELAEQSWSIGVQPQFGS